MVQKIERVEWLRRFINGLKESKPALNVEEEILNIFLIKYIVVIFLFKKVIAYCTPQVLSIL